MFFALSVLFWLLELLLQAANAQIQPIKRKFTNFFITYVFYLDKYFDQANLLQTLSHT
jgi:hypothetical protein